VTEESSASRLCVAVLGGLRLLADDQSIDRFRTHKTAALLAFLAYHSHRPHARETLIEMLWPDLSPEAGRNSLSITLSSLRRLFEPFAASASAEQLILTGRTSVQFNPTLITTDAAEFESALAAWERKKEAPPEQRLALLETATRLYGGPLLPGYYQGWIPAEQTRLEALFLTALQELARLRRQAGQIDGAIEALNRAVALDSLREETQQDLIRLLLETGRPAIAQQRFQQFAAALQTQLGLEPDPATRELVAHLIDRPPLRPPASKTSPHLLAGSAASPETSVNSADAWADLDETASLPARFDQFFGREHEMAQLRTLLSGGARLVTLTGMGGIGKTRLAIELAETLTASRPVLFVPLADLHEAGQISEALRRALDLPASSDQEVWRGIVTSLRMRPVLLILDNFEQLLPEGALFLRELVAQVPTLQCLVTSRRRLLLDVEQEFALEPLPPPSLASLSDADDKQAIQALSRSAALALFVDRARAHRVGFELQARNVRAVVQLVQNLEGLPLALELAAARASILTPRQILDSLARQPFDLLTTQRTDKAARHRSLRETILWSYRLLPETVQRFFRQLAVFRGGWTLEAAVVVTADVRAFDHLSQLRDASLLLMQEDAMNETVRFDMLISLRVFAEELFDAEVESEATRRRHADYFANFVEASEASMHGPEENATLHLIERDYENIRAAFYYWREQPDGNHPAARLACALERFWAIRGHMREGIEWMRIILERADLTASLQARVLFVTITLNSILGFHRDIPAMTQECLRLFREAGDQRGVARVLCHDHAHLQSLQEGIALARRIGEEQSLAVALQHLGKTAWEKGMHREAEKHYQESFEVAQRRGDEVLQIGTLAEWAYMLTWLGEYQHALSLLKQAAQISRRRSSDLHSHLTWMQGVLATNLGDYPQALAFLEQSAATRRRLGACQALGTTLLALSNLYLARADYGSAREILSECAAVWKEIDSPAGLCYARCAMGKLALIEDRHAEAHTQFEESLHVFQSPPNAIGLGMALHGLGLVALQNDDWQTAERHFQEALQQRWPLRLVRGCIESIQGLALAAAGQEQWERFLTLAGATENWRERLGLVLPPHETAPMQTALMKARLAQGNETADRQLRAGAALSAEQAIASAQNGFAA